MACVRACVVRTRKKKNEQKSGATTDGLNYEQTKRNAHDNARRNSLTRLARVTPFTRVVSIIERKIHGWPCGCGNFLTCGESNNKRGSVGCCGRRMEWKASKDTITTTHDFRRKVGEKSWHKKVTATRNFIKFSNRAWRLLNIANDEFIIEMHAPTTLCVNCTKYIVCSGNGITDVRVHDTMNDTMIINCRLCHDVFTQYTSFCVQPKYCARVECVNTFTPTRIFGMHLR